MDYKNFLINLGLSEKEAKIYIILLENGPLSISGISRYSGENRSNLYSILEKLYNKGFVNKIILDKVQYFEAINPEVILENQKKKLENFEKIVPILKNLSKDRLKIKPEIKIYSGFEQIKLMYLNHLNMKKKFLYSFLSTQSIPDKLLYFLKNDYLPLRIKKKIFAYVIAPLNEANKQYKEQDMYFFRETKLIDSKYFNFETEILMWDGNHISFVIFGQNEEMIGLEIISENIYRSFKGIFDFLWNL